MKLMIEKLCWNFLWRKAAFYS